ncbi:MAG: FAD-binding oxidoreductase [Planctomycetes bacterium]|nr:FAD-binding oxidoreductase [Planctomycetota bacterium]
MAISKEAYSVLESIVGPEFISDDPVVLEGYRAGPGGYECGLGYERVMSKLPGCVIMPRTTEEVQRIVKLCSRLKIPYVPFATGFWGPRSHPHTSDSLLIHMQRMDHFELDDKHLYAVVGPGIIYSPLQEEVMKRGAYVLVGGGGSQVSVVANMIGDGWSPLSHRVGLPHRRILGVELVLPDGELIRLGSLACQEDPFWGEGPGPDLRGLLRGYTGLRGCLGIVTKMALKVLPFQPERLEPTGISPNTTLQLPEKRLKWINFTVPSPEAQVKATFEIGKAEIAGAVTKVPLFWRAIARANSKEEFWELWSKESEETIKNFHILRVLLIGFTSEEQMQYDERVLMDIMGELGGIARRTRPTDESWFKNSDSAGMWSMTGAYISVDYIIETIEHAVEHGPNHAELKERYTPPLMPDYGDPGWYQSFELGHQGYSEFLVYWDPEDDSTPIDRYFVETSKMNIKKRFYTSMLGPHQPLYLTGPAYGPNYHKWLLKIKEEFDPQWISHPPIPLGHDVFVERAEWMKSTKDWETPPDLANK